MLAIVIPYYKFHFFEELLESIANQTDKRFRVYIGDDQSKVDPTLLLDKFRGSFSFEYKRFANNLGGISLVKQWNRCLEMVEDEEWVLILGDDDTLSENVVEQFYNNLEEIQSTASVVRFATYKIDETSQRISQKYTHPKLELATDFLFRDTRSSLSEFIFKKNEIQSIGFKDFPLAWFSDLLAVLEFSYFKSIYSINEAYMNIRISGFSISGSDNNQKLKAKATFEFYYFLLTEKKEHFAKNQIEILLRRMSKCYVYNKKEVHFFLIISKLHFNNFALKSYWNFVNAILKNYNKK
jgi:glycosyltransferase involved in cell wall biosynthesis